MKIRPTLPSCETTQLATSRACGSSLRVNSPGPAATNSFQALEARVPRTGTASSHPGAGGSRVSLIDCTQPGTSSAFSTILTTAIDAGITNARTNTVVITVTASHRLRPRYAWTRS